MKRVSDAEIGSLYKEKIKTEKHLRLRQNEARQMIPALEKLIVCFDPDNPSRITGQSGDGHFWVDGHEMGIKYPRGLHDVVDDLVALQKQLDELEEQLKLAVDCA